MDSRSNEERKEKMKRSDSCSRDCRYKDLSSNRCAFETCLLEELPPLQKPSIMVQCCICGTSYNTNAMSMFNEDRICSACRSTIKKWIDNCDAVLTHIKHPLQEV